VANVLTNIGEEWVVDRLINAGGTYAGFAGNFVGWGTGAGTAVKSRTTLFTEHTDPATRATGVISKTGTQDTAKWQCVGTLTLGAGTPSITNAGTFSVATLGSGSLFLMGDFTPIPIQATDSIQFTFTLDPS
jgi:hypothetical protein